MPEAFMRRIVELLILVLCLAILPAAAQSILPDSLTGWSAGPTSTSVPSPANSAGNAAVASAAAAEYGFVKGQQRTYSMGADSLQVAVYLMKDPSGAYGEYSFLRTPDMVRADFTDHSSMSGQRALILTGDAVLEVHGANLSKHENDLKVLAASVGAQVHQGPLPTIWQYLPESGLIERSDHYVLGPVALNQFFPLGSDDWLGFSYGAEAEVARYQSQGKETTLLIADFPTPQIAADRLLHIQRRFNINGSNQASNMPPLFAKRSVTLLTFVAGASTQAQADALLGQVQSGAALTWDEPTFQFKEPNIGTMIVGTIIGAGVICLFAMIAGVAFGGFRLFVKWAFPNMIFDRSSHLEVLQLGLGSKPIKSEDFYSGGSWAKGQETESDKKLPDRTALRIFR
jgi:hypothetical protein